MICTIILVCSRSTKPLIPGKVFKKSIRLCTKPALQSALSFHEQPYHAQAAIEGSEAGKSQTMCCKHQAQSKGHCHTCLPHFSKCSLKPCQGPECEQHHHCCHCCNLPGLKSVQRGVYASCAVLKALLNSGLGLLHERLNPVHSWRSMIVCK